MPRKLRRSSWQNSSKARPTTRRSWRRQLTNYSRPPIAEIEASRADRDRLQAEVVDALEEQGQLLILVEHLEAALESASSALSDREAAAAAVAAEFAARRAEFDAERSKLLTDLEAARTEVETARSDVALVRNEFEKLKSDAASERATVIAERDAGRTEEERLVAELEAARTHTERLAAGTAELEAALDEQRALLHALRSVTKRRNPRRRSLSQLGTWLLPPTPRKLNYLRRYMFLRWSGEFDVDSYLLANPDVLAAGVNPLMHYVEYGRAEGRQPFAEVQQHRSLSSGEIESTSPSRSRRLPRSMRACARCSVASQRRSGPRPRREARPKKRIAPRTQKQSARPM